MATITNTLARRRRSLVTAAMLAGLIVAGTTMTISTAIAAPAPSVAVHYSAAELATSQGVRALYLRIAAAALKVCGGRPDMTDPIAVAWSRGCQKYVIEQAVRSVGNPTLVVLQATRAEMLPYRAQ